MKKRAKKNLTAKLMVTKNDSKLVTRKIQSKI